MEAYLNLTVDQLKQKAKEVQVDGGISKLNKTQLLLKISSKLNIPFNPAEITITSQSHQQQEVSNEKNQQNEKLPLQERLSKLEQFIKIASMTIEKYDKIKTIIESTSSITENEYNEIKSIINEN